MAKVDTDADGPGGTVETTVALAEPDAATADPAVSRRGFMVRLKWVILACVAVVEVVFDYGVEPVTRGATGWEAWVHAATTPLEFFGLAGVIWAVFAQLERLEQRLEERERAYARLYAAATRWDAQLEALHAASVAMAREGSYPAVLQAIVDLAAQLGRARFGALAEFDENERVVEFVTHGVPPGVREAIGSPPTHRGLLRRLSGTASLRLDDVRRDPLFTGFPKDHPGFRTFLGVPIRLEGELLGHLYLGGHEGERPFSEEETRILEMFAVEAAVVIWKERLNRASTRAVRASERRRIAMELHDRTLQSLYALGLQLDRARQKGLTEISDTMSVQAAIAAVERSMRSIRDLLDTLEREGGDDEVTSFAEAIESTAALYGVRVVWEGREETEALSPECLRELAVCLVEAMTNAVRHGGAATVWIRVDRAEDGGVEVTMRDDGRGPSVVPVREGHGLTNMRGRMARLGGTFAFEGAPGRGGFVRLCMPHAAIRPAVDEGAGQEDGPSAESGE